MTDLNLEITREILTHSTCRRKLLYFYIYVREFHGIKTFLCITVTKTIDRCSKTFWLPVFELKFLLLKDVIESTVEDICIMVFSCVLNCFHNINSSI